VTTPQYAIRAATADDAQAILACLSAAFAPYRARYTPDAYRDTVLSSDTIHERLASMSVLVAVTAAGEIVGTIASHVTLTGEGHVRGMAVLPDWQGLGIADQLLNAAERDVREHGCARISLDTTEPLQRAVRFYERHGFRASGRVSDFFGMQLFEYVKELSTQA
jgi:ribosomal-protein-alanine N-acetyltransferase